jgi:hypothetical protein
VNGDLDKLTERSLKPINKIMNTFEKIILGIVIVVGAFVVFMSNKSSAPSLGGVASFIHSGTNTSVSVAASTATLVLAANGGRLAAQVCNAGASGNFAYLNLQGNVTGVGAKGITLNGGNCYSINANNLWTGPVYVYDTATTTITTLDEQ